VQRHDRATATANMQRLWRRPDSGPSVPYRLLIDKTAIGVLLLTAPEVGTLSD